MEQEELLQETDVRPGKGEMQTLTLWNDDINTFEHVIACLVKFIGKTPQEATEIAFVVHNEGKCIILEGTRADLIEYYHILVMKNLTVTIE